MSDQQHDTSCPMHWDDLASRPAARCRCSPLAEVRTVGAGGGGSGWAGPVEVTIKGGAGTAAARPATVVNGGDEVNLRDMITTEPQRLLCDRLIAVLGLKYLSHQLASMLPPDVCMRLADRVEQLTGPEIDRQVQAHVDAIHADITQATAVTLARMAAESEQKRKELHDERFAGHSRLS